MNYYVHPSAIIEEGAIIGNDSKIWHFVHVRKGAKVGSNVSLGKGVYVASKAIIGDFGKIQNNVSLYDNVILENDVFCGPSVVFTNVLNPRAKISRKDEYRSTLIQKGATLGANSTIICGITIGKYSFIGAGAVVSKNVKDFALVVGVPAIQVGWMTEQGDKIDLPIKGNAKFICPKTNKTYILRDTTLSTL